MIPTQRARIGTAIWRQFDTPARRSTLGSLATAAAIQCALLLSGTVAARMLGPADRGRLALISIVPSVLAIAGAAGLALALSYYIAREPGQARALVALVRPSRLNQLAV